MTQLRRKMRPFPVNPELSSMREGAGTDGSEVNNNYLRHHCVHLLFVIITHNVSEPEGRAARRFRK